MLTSVGLDCDASMVELSRAALAGHARIETLHMDFSRVGKLRHRMMGRFDYLLADLGYNNRQLAQNRGFSYAADQPLDMRYSQAQACTAASLIAECDLYGLSTILQQYGEVKQPHQVAQKIISFHQAEPIATTGQLVKALCFHGEDRTRIPFRLVAKVFQALRMAVNGEARKIQDLV